MTARPDYRNSGGLLAIRIGSIAAAGLKMPSWAVSHTQADFGEALVVIGGVEQSRERLSKRAKAGLPDLPLCQSKQILCPSKGVVEAKRLDNGMPSEPLASLFHHRVFGRHNSRE
jgi:hypothetical protein